MKVLLLCKVILNCCISLALPYLATNAKAGDALLRAELAAVALGEIAGGANASMKVRIASEAAGVRVTRVMASCGCVTAELPATATLRAALAAGKDGLELTVMVDPSSYEGAFRKGGFVGYEVDGQDGTEVLEIAVTGTIKADAGWRRLLRRRVL